MIIRVSLFLATLVGVSACDASPAPLDAHDQDAGGGNDAGGGDAPAARTTIRILGINDFHGAIAPADEVPGAGALAATVASLREGVDASIVVSAGDLIGGSPLESGYWHDEPTIEAMNVLGLAVNAIGNHELDESPDELLRLIEGGVCHAEGCGPSGIPHEGATFASLAANTFTSAVGGDTLLAPYVIRELGGQRIAFIGVTLEGTRAIAAGAASLTFGDEAETVNSLIPELEAMGIETIVALVHEGGGQIGGPSSCLAMGGAIVDIVSRMDPAVDVVITGHTHQAYVCDLDGHLVTSAGSNGRLVTAVDLAFDDAGALLDATATNVEVPLDLAPEPAVGAVVDRWVEATRTIRERVVGRITAAMPRGSPELCNLVTDSMLEGARGIEPDVDLALMNVGGIRNGLTFAGAGEITFGDVYTALPFGNRLVLITLTGADLIAALDESGSVDGGRPLCPSASLTYEWSAARRTVPGTVLLNGVPVEPSASYRVVINDFNFAGGGGYTVFPERSTSASSTPLLLVEAAQRLLETRMPYTPDTVSRIIDAP